MGDPRTLACRTTSTSSIGQAQPKPEVSIRLFPLNETINGCNVYGNTKGDKFTVRTVVYPTSVFMQPTAHIEVREVCGDQEPYRVHSRVRMTDTAAYISDINHGNARAGDVSTVYEKPEVTGLGFFAVILARVKELAREAGKMLIEIVPENDELRRYYSSFGFERDPNSHGGRLRLSLES